MKRFEDVRLTQKSLVVDCVLQTRGRAGGPSEPTGQARCRILWTWWDK